MKIALVSPRYPPYAGGVERHVQALAEGLAARGHEVASLSTDPGGRWAPEETRGGVRVLRFPAFAPREAYYWSPRLAARLREGEFDVVHLHSYHSLTSWLGARAARAPVVFTPHYHGAGHTPFRALLLRPYRLLGRRVFERARRVVCVSRHEADLVRGHFGVAPGKVEVIPNGVDLPPPAGPAPPRTRDLLYVGRLEKYKGVHHLLDALRDLQIHLAVVGTGPYEASLRNLARRLGVADRVSWESGLAAEALAARYRGAGALALLSTREAYGLSVAEALACGTPCVVARAAALAEFVDGRLCFGVGVPVERGALVATLRRALDTPPSAYGGTLLRWDDVVEKVERVYRAVV